VFKNPKRKTEPDPQKSPRVASVPSFHRMHPSWRVSTVQLVDPFGWHEIDFDKLGQVKSKLASFESMTWAEILIDGKKNNHSVDTWKLSREARDHLEEIWQGAPDELVSLRLSGRERIWGVLDAGVLILLWWDPEHAVCPSLPRNT
jgi:hypothetical protein